MIISSSSQASPTTRGAFIVLEGVDRCGKTTQCALLLKHLVRGLGMAAAALRFPDRTTAVGQLIDTYLSSATDLEDHAVHLLFSSNRWEAVPHLTRTLGNGETIVCDRYAYSGVAFSAAKEDPDTKEPLLSMEWCKSPDVGLPAPDVVIFLELTQEQAQARGGYGEERYEKKDMQLRVRKRFAELQALDEDQMGGVPWHVVNAAQTIEEVQSDINVIVERTLNHVQETNKPLGKMWMPGEYYDLEAAVDDSDKENL